MCYERQGGEMPDRVKRISAERECCKSRLYHSGLLCVDRDRPGVLARTGVLLYESSISAFSGAKRT